MIYDGLAENGERSGENAVLLLICGDKRVSVVGGTRSATFRRM